MPVMRGASSMNVVIGSTRIAVSEEMLDDRGIPFGEFALDLQRRMLEAHLEVDRWRAAGFPVPPARRINPAAMTFVARERRPLRDPGWRRAAARVWITQKLRTIREHLAAAWHGLRFGPPEECDCW